MELSRRDLLTASAIMLMRPMTSISAPLGVRLAAGPLTGADAEFNTLLQELERLLSALGSVCEEVGP